jgi:hypothetical protein
MAIISATTNSHCIAATPFTPYSGPPNLDYLTI